MEAERLEKQLIEAKNIYTRWNSEETISNEEKKHVYEIVKEGAEVGNAIAQTLLGKFYYNGFFVEKDEVESKKWFELAVAQNYGEAQAALAMFYLNDDFEKAVNLLLKASENGVTDAQVEYANILAMNGYYEEAKTWFKTAAKNENATAKEWLEKHQKISDFILNLTDNSEVFYYNLLKGKQADSFTVANYSDKEVAIFIPHKDESTILHHISFRNLKKTYIHTMYDQWELYMNGSIKSKNIRPSNLSKELISFVYYMKEQLGI